MRRRARSLMLFLTAAACAAQPRPAIVVRAERLARQPLDKSIYGALLEHIGQQMDTMWAELLQDHSFEGLSPFSEQSERWAEGKIDKSQFWWHSGYELHPWRSFGTDASAASVSTAFAANIMHGMHAKVIQSRTDGRAGIAQDGIPLKAGMTYRFSGYFSPTGRGRPKGEAKVTVGLYADAGLAKPYATTTISVSTPGFQKYTATFKAPETSDNATFALTLEKRGFLAVDLVSLMPADNQAGWRADVVAALKDMGLASFRYPGGCFASFTDWETMVGPPEQRLPYVNPFWGGLDPNHVGTDEFLRLMELTGGQPLLEVNMMNGSPERAAAWVEYTNGSEATHYGAMRARNGHPKPYAVKHWELDNEVQRRFSAAQYAAECRRYSKAMRAVDPGVKLAAVGYFWTGEDLETLVQGAAPVLDFLSVRTVDPLELAKLQALSERYATPGHRLQIAATEWRNKFRADAWYPLKIHDSLRQFESSWGHALESARTYQVYQRYSDLVRMAMFPTVSNLYGEDLMNIGKSGIVYTTTGRIVKLLSDIRGQTVRAEAPPVEKLEVNAVVDDAAKRLVCTLVHGTGQRIPAQLDLSAWPQAASTGRLITLQSSLGARADFHTPDAVQQSETVVRGTRGIFPIEIAPYSVSKIILTLQ